MGMETLDEEYQNPLTMDEMRQQVAEEERATDNGTLAQILSEIAELIELEGGSAVYRARAYRKAADTIGNLEVSAADLYYEGGTNALTQLPNIGKSIAERLAEVIDTGQSSLHAELKAKYPPGMVELMSVPGVGPKTAYKLSADYGITSIKQLEEAARSGRLQELFKWQGARLEEGILAWIGRARIAERRLPRYLAEPLEMSLREGLEAIPGVIQAGVAGSFRRLEETIGNLDFAASTAAPDAVMDAFSKLPQVRSTLSITPGRLTVVSHTGMHVDLHLVEPGVFETGYFYYTGSAGHLEKLRERAAEMQIDLPQLGTREEPPHADNMTETEIYRALGLPYLPPELRQGKDELEMAFKRDPNSLIIQAQVQADLHTHTDWSDGSSTMEEMVEGAIRLGYSYYAICDHSGGLGVAGGLNVEKRLAQIAVIRAFQQRLPKDFTLLAGIEVDIRADGTLDCPDSILEQLDWVVASIHSSMRQDRTAMTRRLLRAIEHPLVNVIGHPTTRLLTGRQPVDVDMEEIYRAALRTGTALEVNGGPDRLDLSDEQARRARELGVKLIVSSDGHTVDHLAKFMGYAVAVARRAWCQPADLLNTGPIENLRAFVAAKRATARPKEEA